jgi:Protein of unknown function (DUF3102)
MADVDGMLTEKKAELAHGEFGGWVREHFAGSERHAQRFMKLYRERDQLASKATSLSDLTLAEAFNVILPPKEDATMMSREESPEPTTRALMTEEEWKALPSGKLSQEEKAAFKIHALYMQFGRLDMDEVAQTIYEEFDAREVKSDIRDIDKLIDAFTALRAALEKKLSQGLRVVE